MFDVKPQHRLDEHLQIARGTMTRSYLVITVIALTLVSVVSAQSDKIKDAKDDLTLRIPSSADDPLKSITIHQEIDFTASPQRVYEALLDAKQFTAFSIRPAEINRVPGRLTQSSCRGLGVQLLGAAQKVPSLERRAAAFHPC